MDRQWLLDQIQEIRLTEGADLHPHTIACLVMARTGMELNGRQVRALLRGAGLALREAEQVEPVAAGSPH